MYLGFLDNLAPQLNGWKTEICILISLLCFTAAYFKIGPVTELYAAGATCLGLAVASANNRKVRAATEIEDLKSQVPPANDGK